MTSDLMRSTNSSTSLCIQQHDYNLYKPPEKFSEDGKKVYQERFQSDIQHQEASVRLRELCVRSITLHQSHSKMQGLFQLEELILSKQQVETIKTESTLFADIDRIALQEPNEQNNKVSFPQKEDDKMS